MKVWAKKQNEQLQNGMKSKKEANIAVERRRNGRYTDTKSYGRTFYKFRRS